MNNELLWFTGRGVGMIALVLLTVVVVLGILGRSGRPALGLTRFAVADVHRNASLIGLGLVFVHLIVLWMDPYARLRIFDLLIPFGAEYRPLWVGLGTIGMELMVLVVVTSLLRNRLGARAWKLVHWLSYGMWPIAWLHGWFSGTDGGKGWFQLLTIVCLLAAAGATAWRLSPRFLEIARPKPAPPAPAPGTPAGAEPAYQAPPLVLRGSGGRHHSGPVPGPASGPLRQPTGANPAVPRRSRPGVRALREPTGSQRPVAGPFREPTGAHRTLSDQTGSQRAVPFSDPFGDHPGSPSRAAGPLRDATGSQRPVPSPFGDGSPGWPPLADHTGSPGRVPFGDHTGSHGRVTDQTGSQSRVTDQTGSQRAVPPAELPAFDHEDWFR